MSDIHNEEGETEAYVGMATATPEARDSTVIWKPTPGLSGLNFKYTDKPKLIIHTTETVGLPTYPYPPHFTIDLLDEDRIIYQHVDTRYGAYALKSGSSCGSANYQLGRVYQVEHIGYAKDTPNKPDLWYDNLARECIYFHENHGVPYNFPELWEDGDAYGDWSGRMDCSEFRNWSGICGHQHAPYPNAHWDPGKLNITKLKNAIDRITEQEGDELANLSAEAQSYFQEIYESLKVDPDRPNSGDKNPPGAKLFSYLASFHRWTVKKTGLEGSQYEGIVGKFLKDN